jgi:hypothetical protein
MDIGGIKRGETDFDPVFFTAEGERSGSPQWSCQLDVGRAVTRFLEVFLSPPFIVL